MNVTLQVPSPLNGSQLFLKRSFGRAQQKEKSENRELQRRGSTYNMLPLEPKISVNTPANVSRLHGRTDSLLSPVIASTQSSFFRSTTGSLPAVRKLAQSLNSSAEVFKEDPLEIVRRETFCEKYSAVRKANMSHHEYAKDDGVKQVNDNQLLKEIDVSFPGLYEPPRHSVKPKRTI